MSEGTDPIPLPSPLPRSLPVSGADLLLILIIALGSVRLSSVATALEMLDELL